MRWGAGRRPGASTDDQQNHRRRGGLRLVASLVLVSAGVTVLVAAQLPALPSTATASVPSEPGSAFATSTVLAANPEYGGLSLIVRAGESTASYTGTQGVADSQAVNLGYIGGLLSAPATTCLPTGSATSTSPTAALDPLEAASAAGASTTSKYDGVEAVTVNPSPESAGATTQVLPASIPGLLTINANAVAHVKYDSGQDQEADATSTVSISLLGGAVTLNGLTWTANELSGSTDTAAASFSMTSVTVAGKTTKIASAADLAPVITLVNKVLAIAGITLIEPVESTDSVTGTVAISPLELELTGTALTNTVLDKLNNTETTVEKAISKALEAGNVACLTSIAGYLGDGELIAGIVEGIMAGGGVIDLDIGGASADTADAPNFVDPLTDGSSASADAGQSLPSQGLGSDSGFDSGGLSSAPSTTVASGTTGHGDQPQASASAPAALVRCVSSSPAARPGCWSGAAPVAAGVLLILGGLLFAADIVRSRRKLIRPKETL
ncbi:MAG TPA: hypothetical protein VHV57_13980 [Acidimicrobiales bacterium]|nr:hypothetical protein [Acidimicrobiales bacterium]